MLNLLLIGSTKNFSKNFVDGIFGDKSVNNAKNRVKDAQDRVKRAKKTREERQIAVKSRDFWPVRLNVHAHQRTFRLEINH
jgi:hypothetical protein